VDANVKRRAFSMSDSDSEKQKVVNVQGAASYLQALGFAASAWTIRSAGSGGRRNTCLQFTRRSLEA